MDWLYIVVTVGFFALSWAFLKLCQHMMEGSK
jgi:hypothetical protein